jgi:hypothetical protein
MMGFSNVQGDLRGQGPVGAAMGSTDPPEPYTTSVCRSISSTECAREPLGESLARGVWVATVQEPVWSVDFHKSGYLATAGADKEVRLWRVEEGADGQPSVTHLESLTGSHNKGINVVRFSPSGDVLASGVRPRPSRRDAETRTGFGRVGGDAKAHTQVHARLAEAQASVAGAAPRPCSQEEGLQRRALSRATSPPRRVGAGADLCGW